MQPTAKQIIGARLLTGGAGLYLLLKIYWLLQPSEYFSIAYRMTSFLFGSWLARLIIPVTIEGHTIEFSPILFLWVPWAAVIIGFLLWCALKLLQGDVSRVSYNLLLVIGLWLLVGIIYKKFSVGFSYFHQDLKWSLPSLLSDLSGVAMVIGIGLAFFQYRKHIEETHTQGVIIDSQFPEQNMTPSYILFAFDGRINRANFWGYALPLNIIWLVGLMIDSATTGKPGTFYWLGILIGFWPGLALNVKRCHDRDKSGWFYLVALIPFVNLWYLIDIGFLKGTDGDNRFGPDPLRQSGVTPRTGAKEFSR